MPCTRAIATALLLALAAPALADDGAEICVLNATETLTARGRPHVFETELDCGKKPTPQQTAQAALVHNAMNTADALEIMARAGYEVETASWRDSFTGRQILGVYTLVKAAAVAVAVPAATEPAAATAGDDLPEKEDDELDAEATDDDSAPLVPER
jgi:hypothetical protein